MKLENGDTGIRHEADVGDTYNAPMACNLCASWCSFFEAQWDLNCVVAAMTADLLFDCDLNAPLENTLSKQDQQSEKTNQLHDCNSAFRSLAFMSSWLHVFRDVRHSK
jgi:hypothetical protein